ncbi:19745_t:CDS:2 [Cetraspora pellucida]|uniref:Small ribosomal subunit protein uS10m n=1 Tax=Cetraspora pellucida TaxID=1433469 RepID=A0A9N9P7C8_9GLOM|nr:19745_t:CDS:2 [Cetraspora pellucida]
MDKLLRLPTAFLEPARISSTYNKVVCQLHFRSYLPGPMDFYIDFARRAAHALNMPCSGTVYLPTKTTRWTVIRGPFVHKKSQENFERKTHKRLLVIKDTNRAVVDRWLWYLTQNCPPGVGMRVTLWEWNELGVGQKMLDEAKGKEERRMLKDVETLSSESGDNNKQVIQMADMLIKGMELDLDAEDKKDEGSVKEK